MPEKTNVAIIGCGWAGLRHAVAYRSCGANVLWAVDVDKRRASAIARSYPDTHVVQDVRVALEDPAIDAVSICLPSHMHSDTAIMAVQAGKHVLCEEPMATTLEDADAMVAAAAGAGVTLMTGANVRYSPLYRNMSDLVQEGVIGQPVLVRLNRETYIQGPSPDDQRWESECPDAKDGVMMSGGIHDFEMMRMVVGEITSVHAVKAPQRLHDMRSDDTSIATLRFANGALGMLVESCTSRRLETVSGKEVHTLRIDGELGSLYSPDPRSLQLYTTREDYLVDGRATRKDIHIPESDTFLLEVLHFLKCLHTGQEPNTSGRSQRRSLELVLAAYRSMDTGVPEDVSYATALD